MIQGPRPFATLRAFGSAPPKRRCELCAREIADEHEHVVRAGEPGVLCACRPCALLLRTHAGGMRRIQRSVRALDAGTLPESAWRRLGIPVGLACIVCDGNGRARALFPGPLGMVEAVLDDASWRSLAAESPALADFAPLVEALLVRRTPSGDACFHVSLDVVYGLVGLLRRHRTTTKEAIATYLGRLGVPVQASEARGPG